MDSLWFSNFVIYFENLSMYYVFCICISFLAVFLTWWWHLTNSKVEQCTNQGLTAGKEDSIEYRSLVSQFKMSRQKAIVEQLSAGLTEEQLQQEKEMERRQLEAIFNLLREQEDKFHVNSMEELEDQLRLYRRQIYSEETRVAKDPVVYRYPVFEVTEACTLRSS